MILIPLHKAEWMLDIGPRSPVEWERGELMRKRSVWLGCAVCGSALWIHWSFQRDGAAPTTLATVLPRAAAADVAATPVSATDAARTPLDEYEALLAESEEHLRQWPGYTATFYQQIHKHGTLRERDRMQLKIRHEPYSVYLDWADKGQQVLYVEGANDGRMLARRTRGLLQRTVKLPPTSRIAMMDALQPVTDVGLLRLVQKARRELKECPSRNGVECGPPAAAEVAGQKSRKFTLNFASTEIHTAYSRCEVCFREDAPVPICISCYGWTDDGRPGDLLEHYLYEDVRSDAALTEVDFDPGNEAYAFGK